MKNNIDFYQHYANADQHPKFKMLRVEFGWSGEGKFWALNNRIAQSENCCLDISKKYNKAAIANDLDFNIQEFDGFIEFLKIECELIQECGSGIITTEIIQENFGKVSEKRKKNQKYYKSTLSETLSSSQSTEKEIQQAETIQSKVKESKVKERKLKKAHTDLKSTSEKIYQGYIQTIQPKTKTKKRAVQNITTWISRGRSDNDLISAYKNYKSTMSDDPKFRKNPANFFGINEDYAFDFLPINFNDPINGSTPYKLKTLADREAEDNKLFANRIMK